MPKNTNNRYFYYKNLKCCNFTTIISLLLKNTDKTTIFKLIMAFLKKNLINFYTQKVPKF